MMPYCPIIQFKTCCQLIAFCGGSLLGR
jgi:hypothetical protein